MSANVSGFSAYIEVDQQQDGSWKMGIYDRTFTFTLADGRTKDVEVTGRLAVREVKETAFQGTFVAAGAVIAEEVDEMEREASDDYDECAACGGSGGGPDDETRCGICWGTGVRRRR